jgi:hypothetical protein
VGVENGQVTGDRRFKKVENDNNQQIKSGALKSRVTYPTRISPSASVNG